MKRPLRDTGKHIRRDIFHFKCSDFMREGESGLYVEDYFHEMVYLERRRTERTGRPFVMLLVELEGVLGGPDAAIAVKSIARKVGSMTREVDIKGWYRHGHVLGVIFTDTAASAIEPIRLKVTERLSAGAADDIRTGHLRLTFHPFPEERGPGQGAPADFKLYPDISRRDSGKKPPVIAKRAVDIAGSLLGFLIFFPLFVALPLLIKLTSRGPVLYRQERVGEFGRRFTLLKFRSMYEGADDKTHSEYVRRLIREDKAYSEAGREPVFKIKDDPRVTPVGRFLRKTSLDELPQFLNVLTGQMSLVGPRPPIPYELESYGLWHWRRVMEAKPGITGLWQVTGRSMTSYNDMVRLDLRYIERRSLWLDLRIILLTPFSMVSSRGAY